MDQNTAVMVKAGTIAVILSFFLYKMTATTTLFIIPLLFVSPKFTNTKWALIPVVVVLIALVGSQLYTYGKLSSEIPLTGVLAVGLYLPVTLLIGAFIWIAFSKRQAFERLLMASVVAGLFGFILAAWIMGNSVSANATRLLYKQTVMQMLPVLFGEGLPLGLTEEGIFTAILNLLRCGFLPLFVGQFGLSIAVSEQLINRFDLEFQNKLANWSLNEVTVWPFLASLGGVLFTLFVRVTILETIFWNLALTMILLYMVQGLSIIATLIRRKNPHVSTFRVFILALFMIFIPGINVLPLIALPLLGVSETWINFRKN